MSTSKIFLVTGATSGIGRTTALHLARLGHHVLASGRRAAELASLKAEAGALKLDTVTLDVTSAPSIAAAVVEVDRLTAGHGVDVLVNNAGFGVAGPTIEIDDAELRRQYDTNVFGLMAVTRAFVPKMRERGRGRVINISSVGGRLTLPFLGVYNSTKYALESLSDALRWELRAFGVDVVVIEPGVVKSSFADTALANAARYADTPYAHAVAKSEELNRKFDRFAAQPIVIAKAIAHAGTTRWPAARYVAPRANYAMLVMKALTPTRLWDWAMRKVGFLTPAQLLPGKVVRAALPASAS
jgi:short-subunit dehydrogenase